MNDENEKVVVLQLLQTAADKESQLEETSEKGRQNAIQSLICAIEKWRPNYAATEEDQGLFQHAIARAASHIDESLSIAMNNISSRVLRERVVRHAFEELQRTLPNPTK